MKRGSKGHADGCLRFCFDCALTKIYQPGLSACKTGGTLHWMCVGCQGHRDGFYCPSCQLCQDWLQLPGDCEGGPCTRCRFPHTYGERRTTSAQPQRVDKRLPYSRESRHSTRRCFWSLSLIHGLGTFQGGSISQASLSGFQSARSDRLILGLVRRRLGLL